MPLLIIGMKETDESVGITIVNPDAEAKTGRWCQAPLIPDRCDRCFDPETLAHYPATGYREVIDPDGAVWRHGTCERCQQPNDQNDEGGDGHDRQ